MATYFPTVWGLPLKSTPKIYVAEAHSAPGVFVLVYLKSLVTASKVITNHIYQTFKVLTIVEEFINMP